MRLNTRALLPTRRRVSRVQRDFDCLLERMRHCLYPENMQVLAFYWLRTVCAERYHSSEWKEMDDLLRQAYTSVPFATAVQTISCLRESIQQARFLKPRQSHPPLSPSEPARDVSSDARPLYVFRLLNEWLPVEVAHLMVSEPEEGLEHRGIPVLVVARAIERLLLREHLSRETLESMLAPGLLSPRLVYPADSEILHNVVLFLLGRTAAPDPATLPALLVCVAPDAPLSLAYGEAVSKATVTTSVSGAEELHVQIPPSQAKELLKTAHVRITSAVVTMDGRLWQADQLERAEHDSIVYRPTGRLQIDYSEDHARIIMPWPETLSSWSGSVSFANRLEIFGREWNISHWEQDSERTLLHLVFVASLSMTAIEPNAKTRLRRSHPAAIDMAWAALESALEASLARGSLEPVQLIRREELVPLGRALFGLSELVMTWRLRDVESTERRLHGIHYLSAQLFSEFGLIPWRTLPKAVRHILLADRMFEPLAPLLHEVFEGLPEGWNERVPSNRWSNGALRRLWNRRSLLLGSGSPSRVA
ncbi:MAG TPA: hypothetical protein VG096_02115 [Bryobacteraceae bacterium]|nr:hypothetical protein [Bryobacteraceae bacterium]